MKNIFFLIILAVFSFNSFAQDVIVKKDGKEIEALIIEVHETEIHYKKFNNQSGPTYIVSISSLTDVRYENGDVESYESTINKEQKKAVTSKPKAEKSEDIVVRSGLYYYQGRQISTKKVKQLFAQHNSEEAITMWNRSNMNQGFSYAASIISYPVVLLAYFNPLSLIVDPGVAILISIGGYVVSAGLQVAHYGLKTLYANQRIEAVELYNEDVKSEQQHDGDDYY
jgi:hypothetical protein